LNLDPNIVVQSWAVTKVQKTRLSPTNISGCLCKKAWPSL